LKVGLMIQSHLIAKKKRKLINCPNCESSHVSKALVAPNVSKKSNSKPAKNKKTLASNIKKIRKIVEKILIMLEIIFLKKQKKLNMEKLKIDQFMEKQLLKKQKN